MASSSSTIPTPALASVKKIGTTCALIHRAFERGVQGLVIRLFAAEVFLHQLFVEFDDLIENGRVRGRDGTEITFAAVVQQAFHDRLGPAGGKIDRQAFVAEGLLDLRDETLQINFRQIDFIDDDRARQIARAGDLHHSPRDHFDARLGVDDHGDGFDRRQARDAEADQVGAAGRVDDVDSLAKVIAMQDGGIDGMPVFLLLLLEIAGAAPIENGDLVLDRPAGRQHGIDEGGFPAPSVADKDDIPDITRGVGRHV